MYEEYKVNRDTVYIILREEIFEERTRYFCECQVSTIAITLSQMTDQPCSSQLTCQFK